jgi:hypothetical protein
MRSGRSATTLLTTILEGNTIRRLTHGQASTAGYATLDSAASSSTSDVEGRQKLADGQLCILSQSACRGNFVVYDE